MSAACVAQSLPPRGGGGPKGRRGALQKKLTGRRGPRPADSAPGAEPGSWSRSIHACKRWPGSASGAVAGPDPPLRPWRATSPARGEGLARGRLVTALLAEFTTRLMGCRGPIGPLGDRHWGEACLALGQAPSVEGDASVAPTSDGSP